MPRSIGIIVAMKEPLSELTCAKDNERATSRPRPSGVVIITKSTLSNVRNFHIGKRGSPIEIAPSCIDSRPHSRQGDLFEVT
jgi:hypothetical protein